MAFSLKHRHAMMMSLLTELGNLYCLAATKMAHLRRWGNRRADFKQSPAQIGFELGSLPEII